MTAGSIFAPMTSISLNLSYEDGLLAVLSRAKQSQGVFCIP